LAALGDRQRTVDGLNARVRATSWLGGERLRATVNLLAERDGHLRFEAEVALEGTVATLVTDGVSFALLDARRNELARGPACPANVASLIRIPLAPAEVAAVLLGDGRLPAPLDRSPPAVEWDAARSADVLAVRDLAGQTTRFVFHGSDGARDLIAVERSGPGGTRLWRTSYEDFELLGAVRLPRTIRFAEQNASFDDGVEIRFKDRSIGQAAARAAFTLSAPPGVAVKEIGCGRAGS
jgi:hypothetical protein